MCIVLTNVPLYREDRRKECVFEEALHGMSKQTLFNPVTFFVNLNGTVETLAAKYIEADVWMSKKVRITLEDGTVRIIPLHSIQSVAFVVGLPVASA